MTTRNPPTLPETRSTSGEIDAFLGTARRVASPERERSRLVFALDATMSRQPTWDVASRVQVSMFEAAASVGGLAVQLVYFRGFRECRASRWVADPRQLAELMGRIRCEAGETQIGRVLGHVLKEGAREPVRAMIYVGDAMEEGLDGLCEKAGRLGLLGTKAFMFHEGGADGVAAAYGEIARLTGGAAIAFDSRAPASLAALLRAVAAYAVGGASALDRLASREEGARRLLAAMPRLGAREGTR
jgi:hypothetical protein